MTETRPAPSLTATSVRDPKVVAAIVLALVAAKLIAAALVPLSPDETYYLQWAHFPDWSYYDHPAMGAWWIAAGTALFGDSAFGVRFVAVLSAIPTALAVYCTGLALFDRATALRAALWTNATFLIAVGGLLATPDAPSVMFWAFAVLGVALVRQTGNGVWWLLVGLAAGLGVASKLTGLFLGPAILLVLVVRPEFRRWFLSPLLWAGGAVAVLVLVPMALWNAGHDWVTLTKQFGRLASSDFRPQGPVEFLVTQFAVLNPLVAIFAGLATVIAVRARATPRGAAIALLLWTTAPLVAYMAAHSLHEQIQGHWLAPIFPTLALVAAAGAEAGGIRWAPLAAWVFPVGVIGMAVGFVAGVNPGNVIPPQFDVGQVIRGWDTLAETADDLRQKNGAAWIVASHYAVAAELEYQLRGKPVPVVSIVERARYAFAPPPDPALLDKPALIVASEPNADAFAGCFASVTPVGTIPRLSGGTTTETYHLYLASGAAADLFRLGCDRLKARR